MRITYNDVGGIDLTPPSIRSSGVHVSEVIRDISNTVLKPGQREKYDMLSPSERQRLGNYASVGWAWEQIIRRGMLDAGLGADQHQFISPGECSLDNIYGTPDWFDVTAWQNVEFKATWRSSARPIESDYWEWLCQFKAYCKLLACTSTRLLVFYVNGDYRESGPEYRDITLLFTELEIEDNWEMIVNHAKAKGWVK